MIKLDHLTFAIFDALGETDSWPGNGSMKKREMSDFCERSAFGQKRTLRASEIGMTYDDLYVKSLSHLPQSLVRTVMRLQPSCNYCRKIA